MLKRLIGVITVKDGWAVQSMGYERYLPLGRPEVIAENFDRWQLDEILLVCIDRTRIGRGPDFDLLSRVAKQRIMTPLTYMGGVRGAEDALKLIKAGADRVAIESLFCAAPEAAHGVAEAIGKQAVIRAQPCHLSENGTVLAYDYRTKQSFGPVADMSLESRPRGFSELLLIDWQREGHLGAFRPALIAPFVGKDLQLICFGGITTRPLVKELLEQEDVSSVAVGNSLAYKELAHRRILSVTEVDRAREITYGEKTRGAREW